MGTYSFVEKNGNGTLTVSTNNEEEAHQYLKETVKEPLGWILEPYTLEG